MSQLRFRPVAALLLVLHLAGCMTWQPVSVAPADFIRDQRPEQVRVWTDGASVKRLRSPRVMDNAIEGQVYGMRETTDRVRVDAITLMEIREFSLGRTIGTLGFFGSALVILAVAQAYSEW